MNVADVWEQAEECRIRFKASAAKLPRQTHPPRRHDDGGEAAKYESPQQFFRIQYFMVLDKVIGSIQERFYSPAWKVMNAMERLLVLSIRGEEVIAADVDTVLQHSAGDLDSNLLTELQQLRHITTTDAQRQSVSSFAMGLDILRKDRASFTAIVASSRHTCETAVRSSLFHSDAGTLLQSATTYQELYALHYGPAKTEPFDGDRSPPWWN